MTLTVHVANIAPAEMAALLQDAEIAGTIHANTGTGPWGIEEGSTVVISGLKAGEEPKVLDFFQALLGARGEEAALIVKEPSSAFALHKDGARIAV